MVVQCETRYFKKGLSGEKLYNCNQFHCTSTPPKSGTNIKRNTKKYACAYSYHSYDPCDSEIE